MFATNVRHFGPTYSSTRKKQGNIDLPILKHRLQSQEEVTVLVPLNN